MAQGQGSSVSLRVGTEASFGVDASSTKEIPFIPTLTLSQTQTQNQSNVITGVRDSASPFLGFTSASSSFSMPLDTDLTGYFFAKFLGTVNSVDNTGTFTHTFTRNDTALESMTIEKAHTDLNLFHKGNGFKGNSFTVAFGGEEEPKLDMEFIGQKVTNSGTQLVAPTTGAAGSYYQPFESSITGDLSSENIKSASLTFTNNLDGNQQIIGNNGVVQSIPIGKIGVTGTITATYENDTLMADARANTTKSFILTFTQGTNILAFEMQEIKLEPFGIEVPNPDGLEMTFNFTAFFDAGANGSALTIKMTNQSAIGSYA